MTHRNGKHPAPVPGPSSRGADTPDRAASGAELTQGEWRVVLDMCGGFCRWPVEQRSLMRKARVALGVRDGV